MIAGALAIVFWFAFFAAVHSWLADMRVKKLAGDRFGDIADRWYRFAYNTISIIMVAPFFFIISHFQDHALYAIPSPWNYLMILCQILSALAILVALNQTGFLYFLGIQQIQGDKGGHAKDGGLLVTDGFYCHLRNPLFFFGAIFLWLFPIMTVNLLIFNLLSSIYFYIGALHEEKSLQKEFGKEYEVYKKQVPMFIPRMKCL